MRSSLVVNKDSDSTEKIYRPQNDSVSRQRAAYFNLDEKPSAARVRQLKESQANAKQLTAEPIRATNIFAIHEQDSRMTEIEAIKQRIDKEYNELKELQQHTNSALDPPSALTFPKDSSGGISWNMENNSSKHTTPHKAVNDAGQRITSIGSLVPKLNTLDDTPSRQYAKTDRDLNYIPAIPARHHDSATENRNDSRESIAEKINMLQPSKSNVYEELRVHGSLDTIPESSSSAKRYEKSEYIKIVGQSECSAHGEISVEKRISTDPSPKNHKTPSKKESQGSKISAIVQRRLIQMELEAIERQISEHTRKLVETTSVLDSIKDAIFGIISARQSELKCIEASHDQQINMLNERIDVESSIFEQIWNDIRPMLDHGHDAHE